MGKRALTVWPYPETSYKPAVKFDDEVSVYDEDFVFKGRKINSFTLNGTIYSVPDWADTIRDTFKLLYEINPSILQDEANSRDNVWITRENAKSETYIKKVADDVWVNTGNDTNTKVRLLRQVARLYNLAENDLVFSLEPVKAESEN